MASRAQGRTQRPHREDVPLSFRVGFYRSISGAEGGCDAETSRPRHEAFIALIARSRVSAFRRRGRRSTPPAIGEEKHRRRNGSAFETAARARSSSTERELAA